MLIVPLEEARSGMTLAAPVTHPENPARELLRRGYTLEAAIIHRMTELGVQFLYVEYPELDCLDKHLAVQLSPARLAIYQEIKGSMTRVQKQTRAAISYDVYCATTKDLISTLLTQGQNAIYLDQMARQGSDAVAHAAAVAHLSLLLGLKLEQYLIDQRFRLSSARAKDVVNLGVAGMLHDIGASKLAEDLQAFSDPEPPEDEAANKEWQAHSQIGYELIHNDVECTAAAAVYQHHQHYDGSGFPTMHLADGRNEPMAGEKIHVFGRIIQCANLYDRLATSVKGKRRRPNHQVLALLQTTYGRWCDPQIVRVLQAVAPPYPPGCRVRLSDGSRAVVIDVHPDRPMQPVVRKLAEDNWTLAGDPLDLTEPGTPAILADGADAQAA